MLVNAIDKRAVKIEEQSRRVRGDFHLVTGVRRLEDRIWLREVRCRTKKWRSEEEEAYTPDRLVQHFLPLLRGRVAPIGYFGYVNHGEDGFCACARALI